MFRVTTSTYNYLPLDVDRKTSGFNNRGHDYLYEDYIIVQKKGKTVFCEPISKLPKCVGKIQELLDIAYSKGMADGNK